MGAKQCNGKTITFGGCPLPGPFPGMDPYLESPTHRQGVHNKLITHLEEALNAVLPPEHVANS